LLEVGDVAAHRLRVKDALHVVGPLGECRETRA
jgi:hypothetical protein